MKREGNGSLYVLGKKITSSIRKFKTTEYTLEGRSTRQKILKNTVHAIRQGRSTRSKILKKIQYMILEERSTKTRNLKKYCKRN